MAGMAWLQSTYTIRLNHRHRLFGHVFSGRYKSQLVEGSGTGYLRTACDYVHLNPVRARLLKPGERLLAYPWSSFGAYLAAPEHRPGWIRVDRLLGEHGIQADTAAGRERFERWMERRRQEETDPEAQRALRRGWCLGSERVQAADAVADGERAQRASFGGTASRDGGGQGGADRGGGVEAAEVEGGGFEAAAQERSGQAGDRGAAEAGDDADAQGDCGAGAFGEWEIGEQQPAPAHGFQEPQALKQRPSARVRK